MVQAAKNVRLSIILYGNRQNCCASPDIIYNIMYIPTPTYLLEMVINYMLISIKSFCASF